MKIEKQVCSLELSNKLKELGVPQKSLFRWIDGLVHGKNDVKSYGYEEVWGDKEFWKDGISAFTVAELGEMCKETAWTFWGLRKGKWNWICENDHREILADTEADARAAMLIYLIEQDLINPNNLTTEV